MCKQLLLMVLLVSSVLLGGCTSVLVGDAPERQYAGRDQRSNEQLNKDAVITSKVNARFVSNARINARNIIVETINNVVILTGQVGSRSEASHAEAVARSVPGVKAVDNRL